MMTRVNEMIDALNAQPDAAAGFSAKTLYSTGQQYGLTCKEVLETFLGKEKAISRGLYAAALDADVKIVKAAAKKAVKTVAKKAVKTTVKKATKKAAKESPVTVELIVNDDANDDDEYANNNFNGYIATPEEIAESYN
jgi:hypothetical protein